MQDPEVRAQDRARNQEKEPGGQHTQHLSAWCFGRITRSIE
jgi:hypothetical protein